MSGISTARTVARVALGGALVVAGASHLTVARKPFQAQVPELLVRTLPFSRDDVVLMSGIVELGLGGALLALPGEQRTVGRIAAAFFGAIYPGNLSQYLRHDGDLGLDTDLKRGVRLLFQPALVAAALWSTGTL